MLKTLTTAAGMVLLVSSFALAGQTPMKPVEQPRVTPAQRSQTTHSRASKHHHKHHKKHHATTVKK